MSEEPFRVLDRFKLPIALSLVGIVLIIGGLFIGNKNTSKIYPKESLVEDKKILTVDVSGAVNQPGVYKLKEGSRIEDAISSAGGFSKEAQSEYIAKVLNLAQKLVDGSKIYIPKTGEIAGVSTNSITEADKKININTASTPELDTLPEVGEATAKKIISGRPYQAVEELLSKKVVGRAVFEKIKDQLVVY